MIYFIAFLLFVLVLIGAVVIVLLDHIDSALARIEAQFNPPLKHPEQIPFYRGEPVWDWRDS